MKGCRKAAFLCSDHCLLCQSFCYSKKIFPDAEHTNIQKKQEPEQNEIGSPWKLSQMFIERQIIFLKMEKMLF